MRVVVDGIFFQIASSGIARVWATILPMMAAEQDIEILLLDRGGCPQLAGVRSIPFPSYGHANTPADSMLLQKVCDHYRADVFTSTYYTTPLGTPMSLMVHDMIPELFDFDMTQRGWMEKETAISYARNFVCNSGNTRNDFLTFYPEIPRDRVEVAYCGVDAECFFPRSAETVAAFRARHGLKRDYFLFVGSRVQHKGYKNSRLFFDALETMPSADFDILCVGGERELEPSILRQVPAGAAVQRVALTDEELACAYSGAAALVYPSLYEGFGMPVAEAMACGCPVITTSHGSLAEVAGDAALLISGLEVEEMRAAVDLLRRDDETRLALRAAGLARAAKFEWGAMAKTMTRSLRAVTEISDADARFYERWAALRTLQASVDY